MIVIKPMSGQTKIKATGLFQWDTHQVLEFEDPYPDGTEVHFANKDSVETLVYNMENGVINIPNSLLEKATTIMVWVYVKGVTVLEIEMPINPRPRPSTHISVSSFKQDEGS